MDFRLMLYINSAINPILYNTMSSRYKVRVSVIGIYSCLPSYK
jgi:hypothetical protein